MKRVVVLGASGSIGASSISIIRAFPQKFTLAGFSVGLNKSILQALKTEFPNALFLEGHIQGRETELQDFLSKCKADIVVNGISGAQGLLASIAVLNLSLPLALANKESIVLAGNLLKRLAKRKGGEILPVDSEHSAIFCLINGFTRKALSRVILTASGGPFRTYSKQDLKSVTVTEALNHPTWKMGGKISIDSATLANKALEVIEAVHLFDVLPSQITVSVHPESIVHSLIELSSGEIYAQMSKPDMKFPILNALDYPNLSENLIEPLDFTKAFSLHFEPPRFEDFPLLELGLKVAELGKAYPIAFNAANEVAVNKFLNNQCSFLQITEIVEKVLQYDWKKAVNSFEEVFFFDKQARTMADFALEK